MKVLIGYSMRSGSTLLQHILGGHSRLQGFSDLSSMTVLTRILADWPVRGNLCVKPMDLLYLQSRVDFYRRFDRLIWITRDPRDSYLSALESGYAYLFWKQGTLEQGIDTGLLRRWWRIHDHLFQHPERWYLVKYENLVEQPESVLAGIQDYLQLPRERLLPYRPFSRLHGGDFKLSRRRGVAADSVQRHRQRLDDAQQGVFQRHLGERLQALGYHRPREPEIGRAHV